MPVQTKRAYEAPDPTDGTRVLVDRYWPRGLTKEAGAIDHWLRSIAPSRDLIRWFGHRPERWAEFQRRYSAELSSPDHDDDLALIRSLAERGPVTLLFGARDEEHNNAVALREYLRDSA